MGLFRRVLGTLPAANLNQAATLLAEAHQTLTNGAEGSRTQELVVAALGEAGQTVAAVTDMLRRMQRILESYRNEILGRNPRNFAVLAEGPLEQIRQLQAQLDEYVRRVEGALASRQELQTRQPRSATASHRWCR